MGQVCEEDLITVVIIVGGFAFRAVVRAAWGALVVWPCLRSPVWSPVGRCDGGTRPGLIVGSWLTPLALIVRLLRVRLPLHPPLFHWTVAAWLIVLRARRASRAACFAAGAPRAAGLTARAVPTSIGLTVRRNTLPVVTLVIRSWATVSLMSVWVKVSLSIFCCFSVNCQIKVHALTCLQLFSGHPRLKRTQRRRW